MKRTMTPNIIIITLNIIIIIIIIIIIMHKIPIIGNQRQSQSEALRGTQRQSAGHSPAARPAADCLLSSRVIKGHQGSSRGARLLLGQQLAREPLDQRHALGVTG